MATGDQQDMLARLRAVLPTNWFGDTNPIVTALLTGLASALAFCYSLLDYIRQQARLKTANEENLDIIAADFFGNGLIRKPDQTDSSYRNRIISNLFRDKATRTAIVRTLTDLTGRPPLIYEPRCPADTGAYSVPNSGYGVAGAYGSLQMPYQALVVAYRPYGSGIPLIAGYGIPSGGYSSPSRAAYASIAQSITQIPDSDIYAAIDAVKPAGTIVWTRISN
ncbi:hypothetical protein [Chitinimonas naiadis]